MESAEAKQKIQESADLMPEATYAFKPADGVRTFGQILAHIAGANYVFCAAARGEKAPHAEDEFEKAATTRAAIIKALGDSMAYCDTAFAAVDDKTLGAPIEMPFGMGKGTRASALLGNIGHLNEHYGNLVTYFRIKGICAAVVAAVTRRSGSRRRQRMPQPEEATPGPTLIIRGASGTTPQADDRSPPKRN